MSGNGAYRTLRNDGGGVAGEVRIIKEVFMILRVKVIKGKKINVGDIKGMEIYSVNTLIEFLEKDCTIEEKDCTIEGHVMGDILGYEADDERKREEIGYVTAYRESPEHLFILKRANMKKCAEHIRKVERRQSVKSWGETYGPGTLTTGTIITAISTLIIAIVSIKNC